MGEYKFDRFFYSEDNSNEHYLSEIEKLSDEEYVRLYKGKMYCPLCKSPQLSLVKKEGTSFLRTFPNQHHVIIENKICPYNYDTASKKAVEEYIHELREKKKIKSMLEATLRCLYKKDTPKKIILKDAKEQKKNPLIIEKIQNNKSIKRSVIPHYSFKSWGKNIPQDQLLIVYGKVYVELKDTEYKDSEGNACSQTYIQFRDIRTHKFITSCVKPQTMQISPGNHYAAILGRCSVKESKGHTFYNLWVNFPVEESILLKSFSP